ncbi:MAG: hypothetical protein HYY18_03685 [Planctomycetes bacterium]|nr:hypothetical protein [Planctomycetota bacterium]
MTGARLLATWMLPVAALLGCSDSPAPQPPPADVRPPPPEPGGSWAAAAWHVSGVAPAGWRTETPEEPSILSLRHPDGTIQLRVMEVAASFARPDETMLEALASRKWTKTSSSRFDFLGATALRGDFARLDAGAELVSTQVLWERYEGAPPGTKWIFLAVLMCGRAGHVRLVRDFEEFLTGIEMNARGPEAVVPDIVLADGWRARSSPLERTVSFADFLVPADGDPFVRREIPVSGWLDTRERLREKRTSEADLSGEEALLEALAHYNVALHMLWSQIGAPDAVPEGGRISPKGYLQLFARANAALAYNAASVLKLKAVRANEPWGTFDRLRQNASVLEVLCGYLRTGALDADAMRDLRMAATAGAGDYRELAFALWKELPPAAVQVAAAKTAAGVRALREERWDDAEELGREALAATGGQWAGAHRLIAAAQFLQGRLGNAVGSARNAAVACPGHPAILLEHAEILVAAGRADEAVALLTANSVLLRDSREDGDLLCDYFLAAAHLAAGREEEATAAAKALADGWEARHGKHLEWSFTAFEKNLAADAPGRERILAIHRLLRAEMGIEEFRKAW